MIKTMEQKRIETLQSSLKLQDNIVDSMNRQLEIKDEIIEIKDEIIEILEKQVTISKLEVYVNRTIMAVLVLLLIFQTFIL